MRVALARPFASAGCYDRLVAMNVERTMEFILQSQARAEVRADRFDAKLDRLELQVKPTADLVRQGMKIVQALAQDRRAMREEQKSIREEQKSIREELRQLAKAQARTEATLDRYLKSRSNGHNGNGHKNS